MIVDFEIQSHENGLQGVGAVFGATKKGGHLLRPFRAAAAPPPPARFIHKGQDNRTNIPKRDTDGSDQSSHSTLKPLHQPISPIWQARSHESKSTRVRRVSAFTDEYGFTHTDRDRISAPSRQ